MKKLFIGLFSLFLLSLGILSCEDKIDIAEPQSVDFAFNLRNLDLKNKFDGTKANKSYVRKSDTTAVIPYPECSTAMPEYAVVNIDGENYTIEFTSLVGDAGIPNETEVMQLVEGTYTVNSFEVFDADGNPIYSAPEVGSPEEANGLIAVPFTFELNAFEKTKVNVDVVCWHEFSYQPLAWGWFELNYYQKKTLAFFGDVCSKFYKEFGADGYDFVAAIRVEIYNNGVLVASGQNYEDGEFVGENGAPLTVEYLDNLQLDEEDMTFSLYLETPTGEIQLVDMAPFDDGAWSDEEGDGGFGGKDGVWTFSVGNCGTHAEEGSFPAYLPLPSEVAFTLLADNGDVTGRYTATATPINGSQQGLMPNGTFKTWCVDEETTIHYNVTYNANVYSLLNFPQSNDQRMVKINNVKGKLHWIINHIDELVAAGYNKVDIQKMIWHLVNPNKYTAYDSYTSSIPSYEPKVGDYALVVIDPYNNDGPVQAFGVRIDP